MQAWSPSPFFSPRRGWLLRAKRNLYYYFKMQETTFSQTRINKRILSKDNKPKVTERSVSTLTFTKEIYFLVILQAILQAISSDSSLVPHMVALFYDENVALKYPFNIFKLTSILKCTWPRVSILSLSNTLKYISIY